MYSLSPLFLKEHFIRKVEFKVKINIGNYLKQALPWLQFPSTAKYLSDVQKGRQTQPEIMENSFILK